MKSAPLIFILPNLQKVQNRNGIKVPLNFISIKFCAKRNQHFTESSFQMTFIRIKIRIVRKKIPPEDCAIQSQMPLRRDDVPQKEALNTKPIALYRDEESSKFR